MGRSQSYIHPWTTVHDAPVSCHLHSTDGVMHHHMAHLLCHRNMPSKLQGQDHVAHRCHARHPESVATGGIPSPKEEDSQGEGRLAVPKR